MRINNNFLINLLSVQSVKDNIPSIAIIAASLSPSACCLLAPSASDTDKESPKIPQYFS